MHRPDQSRWFVQEPRVPASNGGPLFRRPPSIVIPVAKLRAMHRIRSPRRVASGVRGGLQSLFGVRALPKTIRLGYVNVTVLDELGVHVLVCGEIELAV